MLENGKQAQHDAALKVLQRRLSLREVTRVKQLVAAGVNSKFAETTARKEYEEDNKKQIEEYEENILKEQNDLEIAMEIVVKNKIELFKNDNEKDNNLVPMRIQNEKDLLTAALALRLNSEELEKVEELVSLGMPRDDAILSARSEKVIKKSKELGIIEENLLLKKSDMKNKLKIKLDYDLKDLKELEKHARKTLEDGLQEHKQKEKKRLLDQIEKRRLEKEAELISSGTNVKKAKELTTVEGQKEILKMESQLENELERAMRLIRDAQKLAYDNRVTDMKAENEKKTKGLEAYLDFRKLEAEKKLTEKLSKLKVTRERQLTASGLSIEEAGLIAEKEYGLKSKEFQDNLKNINDMLLKDGAILRQIAIEGLKREKEIVQRNQAENAIIDDKESFQLLDDLLKKEREILLQNYNTSKSIYEAARDASRYSQKEATKDLKSYREEYERELKRLDFELLQKKEKEEKALQNRLLLMKKNRILESCKMVC